MSEWMGSSSAATLSMGSQKASCVQVTDHEDFYILEQQQLTCYYRVLSHSGDFYISKHAILTHRDVVRRWLSLSREASKGLGVEAGMPRWLKKTSLPD